MTLLAALLPILLALTVLSHLLHLALQLFSFAAQHFLLPTFLKTLLWIVLLVGQVFLSACKGIELCESILNLFLMLLGRRGSLRCFVLILFRVEFEIEQAGEIAACAAATSSTTTALAKCHFDFAEGGFGAQQGLQRFLLQEEARLSTAWP